MKARTLPMLVFLAACDQPFPPETLVERLRVLAVRAEPAEVVDLSGQVTLEALVVDPKGQGRPLKATWAVCLVEFHGQATDIECPGPGTFPIPGEGLQVTLSLPDLVTWLADQGLDVGAPLPAGVPTTVPLVLGLRVEAGESAVRALKRLPVRLEPLPDPPNHNPVLEELLADGQPVPEPLVLRAGAEVALKPAVAAGSQESYTPEGETEPVLESNLFSWFSTAGEFSDQRTILDKDSAGRPLDTNTWTLPEEPTSGFLWLVVRDGRYGTDWLEVHFEAR